MSLIHGFHRIKNLTKDHFRTARDDFVAIRGELAAPYTVVLVIVVRPAPPRRIREVDRGLRKVGV